MPWEIEATDEFRDWYAGLNEQEYEAVNAAVDLLIAYGPALKRPVVGAVSGSTINNLKELRTGSLRVLFVFDPRSCAILLVGGDKRGVWNTWYEAAIPLAEQLYTVYLEELRREGEL